MKFKTDFRVDYLREVTMSADDEVGFAVLVDDF